MLRQSIKQLAQGLPKLVQQQSTRQLSAASSSLVDLAVDDKSGIATLTLNRKPVNSLNLELLTAISEALDQVEENRSKGLILTSSAKTVFSAGLDITEMYKPDQERLKLFWTSLQDAWLKLYGSSFPTAAAINGHSPAGGCLLATSCEYRVMCPNFTIGLNETRLGIVAPKFFEAAFRNVLSVRQAEKALTLGTLFTTEEALKVGLIDEVAADKDEALAKCAAFIGQFRAVSPLARSLTKQSLRSRELDALRKNREHDLNMFLFAVNQPKVQAGLAVYMESLKKK